MTIVVDMGGTAIKIGLFEHGKILYLTSIPVIGESSFDPHLILIEKSIAALLSDRNTGADNCIAIGFAFPGIVDIDRTMVLSCNKKYSAAVGFDFPDWARRTFGLPIVLENDARCALIGEWQYGSGTGCDNIVMITLGTGIGCATLIQGKILRGSHYQAGCLGGHFTVNYNGEKCGCGNTGCVEAEASTWRLPSLAAASPLFQNSRLKDEPHIDYKTVFSLARRGDELADRLVQHSIRVWTAGIITAIHAYDPEVVILGGGIMRSGEVILPLIRSIVNEHAWTHWGKVQIVKAKHSDSCALLGAGYLAEQIIRHVDQTAN